MHTFNRDDVLNIAVQACHLVDGYTFKAKMDHSAMAKYQEDNGFDATCSRLAELAIHVHDHLQALPEQDFPGVFEYEVTYCLGMWFHENSYCTDDQFKQALQVESERFFAQR